MTLHELSGPFLRSRVALRPALEAAFRRSVDIIFVCAAMFLLAPVILVVTLAIWIEGGRPILFSQLRLGQKGRPFRMYKFRKFRPDCDDRGCPLTMQADGRLTRVGRLLAVGKLDELPQLWNVLRGDMSFVGPRPESLAFADCFRNGFEKFTNTSPDFLVRVRFSFDMKASSTQLMPGRWNFIERLSSQPRRRLTSPTSRAGHSFPISAGSSGPLG